MILKFINANLKRNVINFPEISKQRKFREAKNLRINGALRTKMQIMI